MFFPKGSRRLQGLLIIFEAIPLVPREEFRQFHVKCVFLMFCCWCSGRGFRDLFCKITISQPRGEFREVFQNFA